VGPTTHVGKAVKAFISKAIDDGGQSSDASRAQSVTQSQPPLTKQARKLPVVVTVTFMRRAWAPNPATYQPFFRKRLQIALTSADIPGAAAIANSADIHQTTALTLWTNVNLTIPLEQTLKTVGKNSDFIRALKGAFNLAAYKAQKDVDEARAVDMADAELKALDCVVLDEASDNLIRTHYPSLLPEGSPRTLESASKQGSKASVSPTPVRCGSVYSITSASGTPRYHGSDSQMSPSPDTPWSAMGSESLAQEGLTPPHERPAQATIITR
jgi:hypothetical protein